jgi:hypothetical protein
MQISLSLSLSHTHKERDHTSHTSKSHTSQISQIKNYKNTTTQMHLKSYKIKNQITRTQPRTQEKNIGPPDPVARAALADWTTRLAVPAAPVTGGVAALLLPATAQSNLIQASAPDEEIR